jgi:hypothetical protein
VKTILRRAASLVAISALGLFAATTVVAANPHTTYTCVKVKHNGEQDVQVNVPEPAVSGLTNAGFTCVAVEGDENGDEETTTDEGNTEDEDPGYEEPGEEGAGDDDPGYEEPGNGNPGNEDQDENLGGEEPTTASVEVWVPQESRSLYCSTKGPAYRANGEGMGIGLNLPDSQGALMVQLGLVEPATFYQGIGASCDQLPGFKDSGLWVDHVGDVVPGVAVYPLFVTA